VFQLWILDISPDRRFELVEYLTRITKGKDSSQVEARLSHLPTLLFGSVSLKAAESLVSALQEKGAKVEIRHLAGEAEPAPAEPSRQRPSISAPRAIRELPAEPKSRATLWFLVATGVLLVGMVVMLLISFNRYMKSPDPAFQSLEGLLPTPPPPPPPEEVPPPAQGDQSWRELPGAPAAGVPVMGSAAQETLRRDLVAEAESRYRVNDVTGAVALYREHLLVRPDDARAQGRLSFLEREVRATGALLTRDNYYVDLQYQDELPAGVEEIVSDAVYAAFREVGIDFGYFPTDRLTVIVYRDDAFRTIGFGPGWTNAIYDGKIRIPVPGNGRIDEARLRRAVIHEYVHALVHRIAGPRVPTWFNEGLALYEQGAGADPFPTGVAGWRPIPLTELSGSFLTLPEKAVPSAYRTSYLAVRALVDRTSFGYLVNYLKRIGAGEEPDQAFENAFFRKFSEFSDELGKEMQGSGG
jgi:hypothetical protein